MLSESELEQDAVKRNEVVSVQLISQPLKKRSLLGSKHLAVEIVSVCDLDSATVAASHSLNGIRANQKSSPALHLVYEPTTEKGHCLFRGCELGIYPFCNPEKDNCEGLMCPYWVEKGHTS